MAHILPMAGLDVIHILWSSSQIAPQEISSSRTIASNFHAQAQDSSHSTQSLSINIHLYNPAHEP